MAVARAVHRCVVHSRSGRRGTRIAPVCVFFDALGIRLRREFTDRGIEPVLDMGWGKSQNHAYHFGVAVLYIDHSGTKAKPPSDQRHLRTVSQDPAG